MATISPLKSQTSTGEDVIIRSASLDDGAECLSLRRAIVLEGKLTLATPDGFQRSEDSEKASIVEAANAPGSLHLVAEIDGAIVGNLQAEGGRTRNDAHFCDLSNVWVNKQWRGKGIGSLLLNTAIDWARKSPTIEKLGLFVFSTSQTARHLYEKHGFEVEGRGRHDIKFGPGDYADTIIMGRFVADDGA